MIKRVVSIMIVGIIISTQALSMPNTAYGGLRDVFTKKDPLPSIELKGVELKGTAVSGIVRSIAIIEDTVTKKNYWYKVGDTLCSGKITEIHRGYIVIDLRGTRYTFGLPEGAITDSKDIALSQCGIESKDKELILGKRIDASTWEVSIDNAINALTNATSIMKEVRIRPYFAIGKAAGIRIDRIKQKSVIKKMGLKDGDVIKGINGFGVMSPTKVFEAYRKYKNNSLIELQLLREDEPVTLTYNIIK